ncbi:MAG: hypothetical protein AAGA48_10850 [Myxococcota bacterium]
MDERLDAGRRHLHSGRRTLVGPRPRESRSHFEAALRQYRGPELLVGEGDALRGLAEVDLIEGAVPEAEARITSAIARYDEAIEAAGDDWAIHQAAIVGRTHARVVEAQLWLRTGRRNDAETALEEADRTLARIGDVRGQVDAQLALARCALAGASPSDAEVAIRKALAGLERLDDKVGLIQAWLFLGEVSRAERRLDAANEATERAMSLATELSDPDLLGRALTARGTVRALQGRDEEAAQAFDEALAHLSAANAPEDALGFARLARGELWAQQGQANATSELVAAVTALIQASHRQGTAVALLKLADRAHATGLFVYALAVGEAARQWWRPLDPVRGVGLALRLQVKALADLKQWPAVVTLAWVRAERSGHAQPGAHQVDDHYRSRAPKALVDELSALSPSARVTRANQHVSTILEPLLSSLGVGFDRLGTASATLALVNAMSTATPNTPPERLKRPGADGDSPSDPSYSPPYFFSRR